MATDRQARLVLWDIDHTLIETRGMGWAIYERIFPGATGQSLRELATVHGRTELDIMHDTLLAHGIELKAQVIERLAAALADGYRSAIDELTARGPGCSRVCGKPCALLRTNRAPTRAC